MSVAKIRRRTYQAARLMGDVQAVRSGRIWQRLFNRLAGRMMAKAMRGDARRVAMSKQYRLEVQQMEGEEVVRSWIVDGLRFPADMPNNATYRYRVHDRTGIRSPWGEAVTSYDVGSGESAE